MAIFQRSSLTWRDTAGYDASWSAAIPCSEQAAGSTPLLLSADAKLRLGENVRKGFPLIFTHFRSMYIYDHLCVIYKLLAGFLAEKSLLAVTLQPRLPPMHHWFGQPRLLHLSGPSRSLWRCWSNLANQQYQWHMLTDCYRYLLLAFSFVGCWTPIASIPYIPASPLQQVMFIKEGQSPSNVLHSAPRLSWTFLVVSTQTFQEGICFHGIQQSRDSKCNWAASVPTLLKKDDRRRLQFS